MQEQGQHMQVQGRHIQEQGQHMQEQGRVQNTCHMPCCLVQTLGAPCL